MFYPKINPLKQRDICPMMIRPTLDIIVLNFLLTIERFIYRMFGIGRLSEAYVVKRQQLKCADLARLLLTGALSHVYWTELIPGWLTVRSEDLTLISLLFTEVSS